MSVSSASPFSTEGESASLHLMMQLPWQSRVGLKAVWWTQPLLYSWDIVRMWRRPMRRLLTMDDETLCTMSMFLAETRLLIDAVSIVSMSRKTAESKSSLWLIEIYVLVCKCLLVTVLCWWTCVKDLILEEHVKFYYSFIIAALFFILLQKNTVSE